MTSPYSSSLLTEPTGPSVPRPLTAPAPAAAMPAPAPVTYMQPPVMPQVLIAAPRRSSSLGLALVALLVVALAGVAGYAMSRAAAPSLEETARYQALAAREGYFQGQRNGQVVGRNEAIARRRELTRLQALIARQRSYNAGYRAGRRAGYAPRRYYGSSSGGYRYPRIASYDGGTASAINQAVVAAQNWSNATGSPVDVQVVN